MFYVHIIRLDLRYCIFEGGATFYSSIVTKGPEEINDLISTMTILTALRQQEVNSISLVTLDGKQRKKKPMNKI